MICLKQFDRIYQNSHKKEIWPNIYTYNEKNKEFKKIIINNNFSYYLAYGGDNLWIYSIQQCTSYRLTKQIYTKKKIGYTILSLSND